ncbi:MAG: hypothetical protein COU22_03290 [Candidatus Komeilibacteria bacterium CG10_big_fil_rev_8_21_14_0_10_41_13]|uniref:RHS repeat-associated core domain-containing protein n=1 Tax=Candidatus Komeilibacteria bacterium CG10_big_fil_rev_8_21_14_0_10_41_13 TaxID=1974476 RepID=A0A2M6WBS1_9BACT|nr:MAG: hypothetical protein COU22_03290 [Candidatus Komeilibacteria bacterium CG10_big_fil_rev_8_21_14_0_10_41_13]
MRKAILAGLFFLLPQTTFALTTDHLFTGQTLDRAIDLYNYQQRYYQADIGRFTSPDPLQNKLVLPNFRQQSGFSLEEILADPQRLNSYSYSLNNPVNLVDPTGEVAVSEDRQEKFDQISDYIRNDDSYWLTRDRDGNSAALDAIWQKSLELNDQDLGGALDTFYDAVNINWRDDKTLDGSREDYLNRLHNLPNALAGEYGGNLANIDKLQHFVASARLAYKYGPAMAGLLGKLKEVKDGFRALFSSQLSYQQLRQQDEGYSRGDLYSNQAGIQWFNEYKSAGIKPSAVIRSYLYD